MKLLHNKLITRIRLQGEKALILSMSYGQSMSYTLLIQLLLRLQIKGFQDLSINGPSRTSICRAKRTERERERPEIVSKEFLWPSDCLIETFEE